MSEPFTVTDDTFDREVLRAELPILTDFWAAWCAPCHMIAPLVKEMAKDYDGRLKVAKLDVDQNPNTALRFEVRSIPTLILFKRGKEVERIIGYKSKKELVKRIEPHL